MNRYVLLRMQTEPSKEPTVPDEIVVKFFPVKLNGSPRILLADTPEAALAQIRATMPHLAHFFAIEPEATYNATIARLAALSAKRRGSPGGKSQIPQRSAEAA